MITVISGGLRTTRFLEGLLRVIPQEKFTIITNTTNNVDVLGLSIYPDLEYLLFLLAGKLDVRYWETVQGDTYSFMESLSYLMEEEDLWFRFGDTIISHVIFREYLITKGAFFSEAIDIIAEKLDIKARILPMTNDKVTFKVSTDLGDLTFLEYRNKEIQKLIREVKKVEYVGIDKATANPKVEDALSDCDTILIGPSNPPLYIDPMFAFEGIKNSIETAPCNVIAISPLLGDEPIASPIERLMKEALEHDTSLIDVVAQYSGLIDTLIIDESDETYKEELEELGMEVLVTEVRLGNHEQRLKLAEIVAKVLSPVKL